MSSTGETDPQRSGKTSRRRLLCLAGAGLGVALGGPVSETAACPKKKKVLQRGNKVDVGGKGEEIIQKAYELGYQYEKQHGG